MFMLAAEADLILVGMLIARVGLRLAWYWEKESFVNYKVFPISCLPN